MTTNDETTVTVEWTTWDFATISGFILDRLEVKEMTPYLDPEKLERLLAKMVRNLAATV